MTAETGVDGAAPSFDVTTDGQQLYMAVEFQDPEGERATTTFLVGADQSATEAFNVWSVDTIRSICDGVGTMFQSVTNCQVLNVSASIKVFGTQLRPQEPSTGLDDIEDKALLRFETGIKTGITFKVPAPIAMFMTDGETVQPSTISAFCTSVLTLATVVQPADLGGNAVWAIQDKGQNDAKTYDKGYLTRAKTRRTLRQGIATEIGG